MSAAGGHQWYTTFEGDFRQDNVAAHPPGSAGHRTERSPFYNAVLSNQRMVDGGQVLYFPSGRILHQ